MAGVNGVSAFFSNEESHHNGNILDFTTDPAAALAPVATPTEQLMASWGQFMQESVVAQYLPPTQNRKRSSKGHSDMPSAPSSSTDTVAKPEPSLFKCSSCSTKKPPSAFEEGASGLFDDRID